MKEMKFWIGSNEKLSERVQDILFSMGYRWRDGRVYRHTKTVAIFTEKDGGLQTCSSRLFFDKDKAEETNIDWMRSKRTITIEIEGQKTEISLESAKALKKVLEDV